MSSESSTTDPEPEADAGETAPEAESQRAAFRIASRVMAIVTPKGARYERGKELARGGLGRVISGLDRTLQREIAIKELHVRTEQNVRRFVREGLTTARLQHPAIVPILDAGTWDSGDPFLVMKLLEGKTLSEELETRTTLNARVALLPSLLAVADALGFAHEHGVVHRDVKPSNIMLGKHGETVLLDWGVAFDASASKLESDGKGRQPEPVDVAPNASEQLTVAGSLAGTVRYMSPEQARGEPTVPGFDVFSLGVTIATVLAGRPPFEGKEHSRILELLRNGDRGIATLPEETPRDLAAIVTKATAPPGQRYAHAGELADDLRKYITGQLVGARRYTRAQLLARWLLRNRMYVGVVGAALAIVAVIAVVAARRVITERNTAITQREAADARARELVLLQARANLRSDPTATLAWLEQYPERGPHQDQVVALLDEAAGRGVARHVMRSTSQPASVTITLDNSGLVAAHRDGRLVRMDLATGERRELAAIGKPWLFVRATPSGVVALDQDGGVYLVTREGALQSRQPLHLPSRPHGAYYVPHTNELKLVFADEEAMFVPLSSLASARRTVLPKQLQSYEFEDDGSNSTSAFVLMPSGELFVLDDESRPLWRFTSGTWVGSSPRATMYLAIVPGPKGRGMGEDVSIWVGATAGGPPRQLGTMRACAPGADRHEEAVVTDDGRIALVRRCGAMKLFVGDTAREIEDAERVSSFDIAPDGRHIALVRGGVIELVNVQTGAMRQLSGAQTIGAIGFSPNAAWIYSVGGDRETRVWTTADPSGHGSAKIGELVGPVRLAITTRPDLLAVVRQLACSHWRISSRNVVRDFGISPARSRDLDDDSMLWPLDVSADGRACAFAASEGVVIVVDETGTARELRDPRGLDECILSGDATLATCIAGHTAVATYDVASGSRRSVREIDHGVARGLVRYRDAVLTLVARPTGCVFEDANGAPHGHVVARECQRVRASNASQPGQESALIVTRPGAVDLWTERGTMTIPTEGELVEMSAAGLIAVIHEQTIEIWDARTRTRMAGPPPHARAIERLAWSSRGTLATADDETVRLWDAATGVVRVIYAPHTLAVTWSHDGDTLFTSDGRTLDAWTVAINRGVSQREARARLEQLTSARIGDGDVATP